MNYLNYRKPECLGNASEITANKSLLYPYTYPPRFILNVSARKAQNSEFMTLKFIGSKKPIKVIIELQVRSTLGKCSTIIKFFEHIIIVIITLQIAQACSKTSKVAEARFNKKLVNSYFSALMEAPSRET